MKLRKLAFGVMAVSAILFTACDDSTSSDGDSGSGSVIGTWSMPMNPQDMYGMYGSATINFANPDVLTYSMLIDSMDNDGTMLSGSELDAALTEFDMENPQVTTGTWKQLGSDQMIIEMGGEEADTISYVLSGNTLTITDEDGDMVLTRM